MARSNVPKFGNWENDDDVPYTVYFDKARKTRGGKMINPNDPQENPDMFPNNEPPSLALAPSDPPPPKSITKPNERISTQPENRKSREDGELRQQFSDSPARGENTGQKVTVEAAVVNELSHGGRAQRPARPTRRSEGSEQSIERSPLHPHYQAKVTGRGSGSPAWEGKNHDSSHGTPGRSRLKQTSRGDESPEKGAAVPRFGEWDENDPQAAENFTHIFNKVREERNTEAGNVSGTPKHHSYGTRPQPPKEAKKPGCFCW